MPSQKNLSDLSNKFDRLRRLAEELITQPSASAVEAPTDVLELIHELKIHQAELEIQNEELKRAQLELTGLRMTLVDISAKKRVEETLARAGQDMENQVISRTAELSRANQELQREIVSRVLAQGALQQRKKELRVSLVELEEANVALKVLLKERENERYALKEKVVCGRLTHKEINLETYLKSLT